MHVTVFQMFDGCVASVKQTQNHVLDPPIVAGHVSLRLKEVLDTHHSMRFEMYGCVLGDLAADTDMSPVFGSYGSHTSGYGLIR